MEKNWNQDDVLEGIIAGIKKNAEGKKVLLFLSGGVDSTVTFALLNRALGKSRVMGLHIDNGFMRKNESAQIAESYKRHGFDNFVVENASCEFLKAVKGMTNPQKKREAVGETFIAVRDKVVSKLHLKEDEWMLAQGTLYPDIIESGGTKNSKTIKTHHNRVSGIRTLLEKGLVIEPLRELYKDEVRSIGEKLSLDKELIMRHPFPGPGLSINVICSNGTASESDLKERAKAEEELSTVDFSMLGEGSVKEHFVLPVRSVGVQGDFRTYRFPCVISSSLLDNGFYAFPWDWDEIEHFSSAVTNGSTLINRVLLRLFQRPGAVLSLQESYCDSARLDRLREGDAIVLSELRKAGWYNKVFQHLTIDIPYTSGSNRSSFVLRPVESEDVMTARFSRLPRNILDAVVQRIASLPFADAVYFDATNKPPATFGWE